MTTATFDISRKASYLNRTMPALSKLEPVTAGDHFRFFYAFDTADVWTADGWLVTAVQNDGETCYVRKGDAVARAVIDRTTTLYYVPTAKTKYCLAEVADRLELADKVVEVDGAHWKIRFATTMDEARAAIALARCSGSIGSSSSETREDGKLRLLADVIRLKADGTEATPYNV